jgi:hypothetical protein
MNSTTIIGIILLFAIILPVWILIRNQNAGKRKLEKEIKTLGKGEDLNISEHESWGNKIIGLDRDGAKVAFVDQRSSDKKIVVVDLKIVSRCYLNKETTPPATKKGSEIVNRISLNFVPNEKGNPEEVITLFLDTVDMTLTNELHIAGEWMDKINVIIRKNTHIH